MYVTLPTNKIDKIIIIIKTMNTIANRHMKRQ